MFFAVWLGALAYLVACTSFVLFICPRLFRYAPGGEK